MTIVNLRKNLGDVRAWPSMTMLTIPTLPVVREIRPEARGVYSSTALVLYYHFDHLAIFSIFAEFLVNSYGEWKHNSTSRHWKLILFFNHSWIPDAARRTIYSFFCQCRRSFFSAKLKTVFLKEDCWGTATFITCINFNVERDSK